MPKPEWGAKRTCDSCGVRFYDLNKDPIVCPECGASFALDALLKPRRGRAATAETPAEDAEVLDNDEDEAVLDDVAEDDADEAVEAASEAVEEDESEADETLKADDPTLLDDDDDDNVDDELGEYSGAEEDDDRR